MKLKSGVLNHSGAISPRISGEPEPFSGYIVIIPFCGASQLACGMGAAVRSDEIPIHELVRVRIIEEHVGITPVGRYGVSLGECIWQIDGSSFLTMENRRISVLKISRLIPDQCLTPVDGGARNAAAGVFSL